MRFFKRSVLRKYLLSEETNKRIQGRARDHRPGMTLAWSLGCTRGVRGPCLPTPGPDGGSRQGFEVTTPFRGSL